MGRVVHVCPYNFGLKKEFSDFLNNKSLRTLNASQPRAAARLTWEFYRGKAHKGVASPAQDLMKTSLLGALLAIGPARVRFRRGTAADPCLDFTNIKPADRAARSFPRSSFARSSLRA